MDTTKLADISSLIIFLGTFILLNGGLYEIKKLQPVIGGVKLTIADSEGELILVGNGFGHDTIDVNNCKKFIENNSAPKP